MKSYIFKKLFVLLLSFFSILTITFFLMKAIPGNPFSDEQNLPKEILSSLNKHYGFDKPIYKQYLNYLKGCIKGDLGPSYIYSERKVQDIIFEGFHISAILGIQALIIAIIYGILLGSLAALYKGKWIDTGVIILAIIGISIPGFVLATFLQYTLSIKLSIFPIALWGGFSHTILPSIALAATPAAFIARLTRTNMIETLQQDYIKTAFSKGLSSFRVIYKHAIRNSILPIISYIGPVAAQILTGSFVIEKIFGIPGIGLWLIQSISNRDYTLIMGITLFYSGILLLLIFICDVLYSLIDPRIRIKK